MVNGIDVSKWQGYVDFNKVKAAGYKFVIINAGFGRYLSQKDPFFEQNYKNAKAAGLGVGAYWYSYAKTAADATVEANVCLQVIKGKKFEYPIAFDFEDPTQSSLSSSTVGDICHAFLSKIENAGYYAAIYSMVSWLGSKIPSSICTKYDVWCAHFTGASKPSYNGAYGIWQWSSTAKVNGVSGNTDVNRAYKDYPELMKTKGLNGYPKSDSKPTLDASGYKKGDSTIGVLSFKQLLITAYNKKLVTVKVDNNTTYGEGTAKAVNQLLKKWGYTQNGIAGANLIKKLGEAVR